MLFHNTKHNWPNTSPIWRRHTNAGKHWTNRKGFIAIFCQRWLFLMGALWCVVSSHAYAESNKTYRYAIHNTAPWVEFDKDKSGVIVGGVAQYYAERFAKASGYTFEIIPLPYQRAMNSIDKEDIDFVISLNDPQLNQTAIPYIQLGRIAVVTYSLSPVQPLFDTSDDVTAITLRGIPPVLGSSQLIPNFTQWRFMETNSEFSSLIAANRGYLDAAVISQNLYDYALAHDTPLKPHYVQHIGFAPVYGWLSKQKTHMIDDELEALKATILKNNLNGLLVFDWKSTLEHTEW